MNCARRLGCLDAAVRGRCLAVKQDRTDCDVSCEDTAAQSVEIPAVTIMRKLLEISVTVRDGLVDLTAWLGNLGASRIVLTVLVVYKLLTLSALALTGRREDAVKASPRVKSLSCSVMQAPVSRQGHI